MTTLQEALPCPFCGKQHTLQVISGQELMGEDQEFWQHSESFGVVCDASTPDGKGGCGAMGGFKPTEDEAIEAWNTRTALAQQGEQQPIGYVTPGYFAFGQGMIDERQDEAKCVPVYAAAPAPQVTVEPGSVVNMGLPVEKLFFQAPAPQPTSGDYALGYAEGFNDACKPASQSAQDVPEVGFGNMPTKFLANGTRFKLSFDTRGKVSSLWNFMDELDGRWVALVAAEDDCHLQSAQPVAQPLAKTCDTCAHYQQGKHPGVSIHDETCYECRSYWGNKWEAA